MDVHSLARRLAQELGVKC